ncbi:MAG: type II secretion system protein [Opitutae bacterium]|nr:type II secretion system protein [Opitutae bacterium]
MRRNPAQRSRRGFTLAEVLCALVLMAIVIPVAMQGVSVASRAGSLGERKATAMRIARSVLNELLVTEQAIETSASGTVTEGSTAYPWTMESTPWSEDAMSVLTVKVTFSVQGNSYDVSVSTLYDPYASSTTAAIPEAML